jgi:putative flippase GtrA
MIKVATGIILGIIFAFCGDLIWTIRDYQSGKFYE